MPSSLELFQLKLNTLAVLLGVSEAHLFRKPSFVCLRLNPKHPNVGPVYAWVKAQQLEPVEWRNSEHLDAYWLPVAIKAKLTQNPQLELGSYYLLDGSSLLAALALDPQPGEEILDLAAAPGGKTLVIAQLMQDQGRLAAVDAAKPRYFKLCSQLKQHCQNWVATYLMDGREVGKKCPQRFDRILLDAPCSGEAQIDPSDTKTYAHWSPAKVRTSAKKQKRLIQSAFKALKVGGTLVYCTCTVSVEENEAVVDSLVNTFGDQVRIEAVFSDSFTRVLAQSEFSPV